VKNPCLAFIPSRFLHQDAATAPGGKKIASSAHPDPQGQR